MTALRGAVCYDWFQSSNGSTWYYYTTTTTNTVTMTSIITSNNALPSSTQCPDLSTNWKGSAGVPNYSASGDNGSANANDYDGFMASLCGDYNGSGQWVQVGYPDRQPVHWSSLNGAALTETGGTVDRDPGVHVPAAVEPA